METTLLVNNFSSGELSPRMAGRPDLAVYHTGCKVMRNCLPSRYGNDRLPGSYFAGYSYNSGALKARQIEFKGLAGTYSVELTNLKMRFWKLDDTLVQSGGSDFELTTPYTTAQLWEIQKVNIKGKLYLVHPSHAPRILEEFGAVFTLTSPTFTGARTFSTADNYPAVVFYHAGRLGFASTNTEPTARFLSRAPVAASGLDRFTDFTLGTNPDDAIYCQLTDNIGSRIRWIVAHRRVVEGQDGCTLIDSGDIPTPSAFYMQINDYQGVAPIQAVTLGNAVFYVSSPDPRLHMMVFSSDAGGFVDYDLSEYSDHILEPGVVEIASMQSPKPSIWLLRSDGVIASCMVNLSGGQISVGWARHQMADSGFAEGIAVVRTSTGSQLRVSVLRGALHCIEHIDLNKGENTDFTEIHFVDCGLRKTYGAPTATITGLSHLNGKAVDAIADGSSMPRRTVSGGQVVYDREVSKIHIGLPHTAEIQPMPPELQVNSTWQGKKKRLIRSVIRLLNSCGGKVGPAGCADTDLLPLKYLKLGVTKFGEPPEPFTGDKDITVRQQISTDGAPRIVQDQPFPFTVLAMMNHMAIEEE